MSTQPSRAGAVTSEYYNLLDEFFYDQRLRDGAALCTRWRAAPPYQAQRNSPAVCGTGERFVQLRLFFADRDQRHGSGRSQRYFPSKYSSNDNCDGSTPLRRLEDRQRGRGTASEISRHCTNAG